MAKIKETADALAQMGKATGVQAPDSEAAGIGEVAKNVKQYQDATAPAPVATPAPARQPNVKEKVNAGPYGSKPGEKRIDVTDMVKPLGKFHKGTPYVPKSGPYNLEKGEAVVQKEDNPVHQAMKGIADIMGGDKPAKAPKVIKEIRMRKGHEGKGYIAEHHHDHPDHKMEEHVLGNQDHMVSHMMEHMGDMNPGEAEADAGQSGVEAEEKELGMKD